MRLRAAVRIVKNLLKLKVRRVVTQKAVPAEVDLRLLLEKDTQQKLNND